MAKTKELKKRYGAEEGEESSRQSWKESSRAGGSSFQRVSVPLVLFAMTRFEIIDGETNRYDSGQVSREYKSQG